MSISRPFKRNYRALKGCKINGWSPYIIDKAYADCPQHYTRAFFIIQNDLKTIFEYLEASPESLQAYSFRLHALLMRTCIEVEANFRAILSENIYKPEVDRFDNPKLNMSVYRRINKTHRLSSYQVILPYWNGPRWIIKPFEEWRNGKAISWYQAYNQSKHDRRIGFKSANLENVILSVAGLLVLLSSQFGKQDFDSGPSVLSFSGTDYDYYEMENALGGFFRIKFPEDWEPDEIYDFDWQDLKNLPDRFQRFDYNNI